MKQSLLVAFCLPSQIPYGVCNVEADVDYLLIAKPVAINYLGIRRGCVIVLTDFRRLLVVPSESRHLGCLTVTMGSVFEICEIGE